MAELFNCPSLQPIKVVAAAVLAVKLHSIFQAMLVLETFLY